LETNAGRIFNFIIFLVALATEWKTLEKFLKIISFKTTDLILMKLHNYDYIFFLISMATERISLKKILKKIFSKTADQKHCRSEFLFHHYNGCHGNQKKKDKNKCLKIFSSRTIDTILIKHYQNHNCHIECKRHSTIFFISLLSLLTC